MTTSVLKKRKNNNLDDCKIDEALDLRQYLWARKSFPRIKAVIFFEQVIVKFESLQKVIKYLPNIFCQAQSQ